MVKYTQTIRQLLHETMLLYSFVEITNKKFLLLLFHRVGNQGERYCGNAVPPFIETESTVRIKLTGMISSSTELKNIMVEFVYKPLDGNVNKLCFERICWQRL